MLPHIILHLFLTYLIPYISFPLTSHPLRFQAGCRKRRLNMALVFGSFCLVVHLLIGDCECVLFVVLGLVFFRYEAERLARGETTYVVSSGIAQTRNSVDRPYRSENVAAGADGSGAYAVNDRHVADDGHENERVDSHIGGHVDQVVHQLAADLPERPCARVVLHTHSHNTSSKLLFTERRYASAKYS